MAPRPTVFATPAKLRAWLERHHGSRRELIVRCFKTAAANRGITYRQALDEALCFGWIDGVRRSLDDASFTVRFTPRTAKSYWSRVNTRRYRELDAEGRVRPPGRAAFRARVETKGTTRYSFESRTLKLDPALARSLRSKRRAWEYFQSRPPGYRRLMVFWVMSAKREETRAKRLAILIAYSARGKPIPLLDR